jgi:pyrroline-5-carboxylate reductase
MTAQHTDGIAFIGGGNMAMALIGGLVKAGHDPASILVVEPLASQRDTLKERFGLLPLAAADADLARASTVVWAVKPQFFAEAAAACAPFVGAALQVSVMAGIRSESIALATGSQSVVRAMPNTPALIGHGIAGLYARPTVGAAARTEVADLFAPTGQIL